MFEKIGVSVIVPAYNCALTLPSCLDSILGQEWDDYEVIIVNDGSSDGTLSIIERYTQLDERIRYIENKKNLGLYETRLRGFSTARGEFITTCDADDCLLPNALADLVAIAEIHNADLVHGRTVALKENGAKGGYIGYCDPFPVSSGAEFVTAFLYTLRGWNIYGKLFRRKVWEKAANSLPSHERLFLAEDLLFNFALGLASERYVGMRSAVYKYHNKRIGYFSDSETGLLNVRDHLKVISLIHAIDRGLGQTDERTIGLQHLSQHIVSSIRKNISESSRFRPITEMLLERTFGSAVNSEKWKPSEVRRIFLMLKQAVKVDPRELFILLGRYLQS